ncbi:MAG TPA: type I DNA topoisomerase [Flavobacteriales bacterium]|jgi:DNA topoisomerase-1|nr:type I DNA topoisomerase [Flavobacteriales bacterium]
MNLVIVESPAKAKTIEKILGKDFQVKSSYGHVRDLSKKGMAINLESGFEPSYEVMPDKKKVIAELKKLAKKADMVWLATDEDREGEAISWHLAEVLGLDPERTHRIVFNEITPKAIEGAINNPREINKGLVLAQQARRVLDRIVGYELSPVLWRKVKPSLSAGRVQSVAVRLIVDREDEIKSFNAVSYFKLSAIFQTGNAETLAATYPGNVENEEIVNEILGQLRESKQFSIASVEKKPAKKTPPAPFTTSSLQQEASRRLGYSVSKTMMVAQKLYESGMITYMRTDSLNLSADARNDAAEVIRSRFGDEYSKTRVFKTKSKGAQEAHEAIRPTSMARQSAAGESSEKSLYKLIWERTMASQMADAILEKTTISVKADKVEKEFSASGMVIKFDGFMKVLGKSSNENNEADLLPELKVGDKLSLDEAYAAQKFTRHPARFSEASLVKQMEELGIGRPSTYAPTISTIQKRGYVEKKSDEGRIREVLIWKLKNDSIEKLIEREKYGTEKNKLHPTDIGVVVNGFLVENFGDVLDYNFTAKVEQEFDEIATGLKEWNKMIGEFYSVFEKDIKETLAESKKATGARLLGEHPENGKPVYARLGRYGAMIQIGETEDEDKPQFASLLPDQSISTITFKEAMSLFDLPRKLGEYNGKEVTAAIGRYGPYVKWGNTFTSIPKEAAFDVYSISFEQATKLVETAAAEKAKSVIHSFEDEGIVVLNGKYGPYIKKGRKNYKIPKGTDPEGLSLEDCKEIIDSSPKRKPR